MSACRPESFYRSLYEHNVDAVLVSNADGSIQAANPAACEMFGRPEAELCGMGRDELVDETSFQYENFIEDCKQGGTVRNDLVFIRGDGHRFWGEVTAIHCSDDDERSRTLWFVRDLSRYRRAEGSLQALNRELHAISHCHQALLRAGDEQNLLDEICRIICDEAGYLMAWVGIKEHDEAKSTRLVAWAGFDSGYIEHAKLTWDDDSEYGRGPSGIALRSGEIVYSQDIATDSRMEPWRDGALKRGYRSSAAFPLKNEGGEVFGVLTIYASEANAMTPDEIRLLGELADDLSFGIDVLRTRSERGQAEEALRQSEQRYRTIFENSPLGIFRSTPDGRFIEANPAMAKMFGYASPESMIRKVHNIGEEMYVSPEDRKAVISRLLAAPGDIMHYTHTHRRQDGSEFLANLTLKTIRDAEGAPAFFDGIIEDITEQRKAEEARERLQAQLLQVQKMDSIGRLAGGVAHDFNNMLGVIIGYSELVLRQLPSDQNIAEQMREIQHAAKRSADLTRQLLTFARQHPVEPDVLNLNEAVEDMLAILRRMVGEDIELQWRPSEGIWPVCIDPSQLDQILANLCVNARDAIDGVGKIVIETDNEHFINAATHHPEAVAGDYIRLSISDNGSGMDQETLDKIFEPFFTTKAVGVGTGLGLSTLYGIVEQNKGFINVYSEPGLGTTFKIYLPRHMGEIERRVDQKHDGMFERGNETILLVEDEAAILEMAGLVLGECGYHTLVVQSPEEALRVAAKHGDGIQLLITDMIMPGMNGRDLADRLVSMNPALKCIFMSGYSGSAIGQQGILDEGVHFIQKPFSMSSLTAKVRQVMDE